MRVDVVMTILSSHTEMALSPRRMAGVS
jgi:hypothetical protein